MTLRELRYLVAIADHRHFGRAAEACCVTQPTLSAQLRKLEAYLGMTLIDRSGRQPLPTPIGEQIVERARRLLEQADEILLLTRLRRGPLQGALNVGVIPTLAPYYLPWLLPHVANHYPRLHLVVVEETTRRLEEKLNDHLIDAAFLALPAFSRPDMVEHPLFDEPFFVACPPDHAANEDPAAPLDIEQLTGLKLLLLTEGHCLRGQALAACGQSEAEHDSTADCRATSLETLRHLVAAGLGYTMLPALAARSLSGSSLSIRPLASGESRRIGLVWRTGHPKSAELRRLAAGRAAGGPHHCRQHHRRCRWTGQKVSTSRGEDPYLSWAHHNSAEGDLHVNRNLHRRAAKALVGATALFGLSTFALAQNLTRDNGAPVGDNQNSQTAGPGGPVLLQDVQLIQKLQRFDRERVPERVVHARGTGAHGEFVATADISNVTRAKVFTPGTKTPVFVRFSTVVHGTHSPETLRDPRGFATKFYTAEGNWDLVGNNLPVFFIRDAIKFPDMVHSLKPSPDTNLQDPNRFFDFFSHVPEATHMLTRVYSDYGTPASYRTMDGNGVHAYKFVNAQGVVTYVKFHWKSLQGEKNLTAKEASAVQGRSFNHATEDLIDAINKGNYPKWELYVQLLKPEQLDGFDFNPLDATKVWLGVPEQKIGTMTLNRNPANVFQETEQSAFAPGNLVPGIEPSEDRLLQGRVFSYNDTQLYRVGTNVFQLPINAPKAVVNNNNQDGDANSGVRNGKVNYEPSRLAPKPQDAVLRYSALPLAGSTQQARIAKTLNFRQAGDFYRSLPRQEQANLVSNLAGDLGQVKDDAAKYTMLSFFYKADSQYGAALAKAVNADAARVQQLAGALSE